MATLITGGTGFVGNYLIPLLSDRKLVLTSRNANKVKRVHPEAIPLEWDPMREDLDLDSAPQIRQVINLMGESIAEGRWTEEKKKRIRDSRIEGTRRLVDALLKQEHLPEVFVSASAVGIYGNAGDEIVDESHPTASGFLAEVCEEWEAATDRLAEAGVRVVKVRIGIVLGADGGALEKLVPIFKWGIGGKLGNGKHYVPWIHVKDLASLFVWATDNSSVSGVLNGSAPNPETNTVFTKELARALNRPAFLPVPKFGVKLLFGEFAESLFSSQRVIPKAALDHGFEFEFSELRPAIEEIIK